MMLRPPALAAALVVARIVSAQVTPAGPNQPVPYSEVVPNETPDLEWPPTLGATGAFGRAVAGPFTEAGIRDAVLPSAAGPAAAEAVYSSTISVAGATAWPLRCSIPLAEVGYPVAAVFAIGLHRSALSDGVIPLARPSALGCYGTDFAALQTSAGPAFVEEVAMPVVLLDDPPEPGEPPHDTAAASGVVPQADVPDFGAGEIPRPDAP